MGNENQELMQEAMRLAKTPAGQQLLQMLLSGGGEELRQAMSKAAAGDFSQARQTISSLLNTPEGQRLLEQMGGNHGRNG